MNETYLIEFRIRPAQLARFHTLLGALLDAMRHEATFRGASLLQDPANPCRVLLVETWSDRDDVLNIQLHRPYRAAWHAALPELLEGERIISTWHPLRADPGPAIPI